MNLIRHVEDQCWDVLQQVSDPEIPVLSVIDLGMIRGVELNQQDEIVVRLTPTYSGCPATDVLKAEKIFPFFVAGVSIVFVAMVILDIAIIKGQYPYITENIGDYEKNFKIPQVKKPVQVKYDLFEKKG